MGEEIWRPLMPLLEARKTYKPFEYPWAYDFWKRQQQIHWLPEEVPLGEDCRDWAQKISEHERNLLTQIFRFFTQADVEVQDCYHDKYGRVFKPTEVKMMLTAFSNMETVHIAAYSHLLDTIGIPKPNMPPSSNMRKWPKSAITCTSSASTMMRISPAHSPCSAASPKACSCSHPSRC
jgi:ribonucleotide reductase beta subunit family protein with ferritin-like domain